MVDASNISLINRSNDVEILKDIEVPERFFNRIKLGVPVLDEIFGGEDSPGLLSGISVFITGTPGAGKSTAALQFGELIQRNSGRNVLYNVGEESKIMIKMRATRLGIDGNFCVSMFDDVNDLLNFCSKTGVEVLFQDSLQSLADREYPGLNRKALWKMMSKKLHRFASSTSAVVFIIGHVTKGGDFAGPMEIKHDLDIHAHIKLNPESKDRIFELTKNRFGPAGIPYEFHISSKGLDFSKSVLVEPKKEHGVMASERREKISGLIKEMLLKGEQISGYCYTRFNDPFTGKLGVDCSGSYWRTMIEKARQELEMENHATGEVKINGRTHVFVEV